MAEKDFVKLKNVTKIYQMGEVQIRAVDGIDFSIDKGEFVVVVGPSGAGKTTVLNILGGMDKASGGEVLVDGKDIAGYSQKQLTGYRRNDRTGKCRTGSSDLSKSPGCKDGYARGGAGRPSEQLPGPAFRR